jgi:SAM-dependent methyltransferase
VDPEYAAAYPRLYREHWWWRSRERILIEAIERLVRGMDAPRILDVGCGAGLFFDVLGRFGLVEGVESDASAVEQSGRWRERIHVGELSAHGDPMDLVLLLDILEHVPEPRALLATVASRLSPRGRVLITVPAFQCLWTSHDVLNHHVRRYTAGALRGDIEAAGLAQVESRYLFQSLVLPKLITRAVESLSPRAPCVPSIPPAPVNAAAQAWVRVEHAVFGWLPFGGSVMAVAAGGLSLEAIPGMRASILEGLKTPVTKCAKDLDW